MTTARASGGALERFVRRERRRGTPPEGPRDLPPWLQPRHCGAEGGWHSLLERLDLLDTTEREALALGRDLLTEVQVPQDNRPPPLIMSGPLFDRIPLDDLCRASHRLVMHDARLIDDIRDKEIPAPDQLPSDAFAGYWRRWPIAAWAGELSGADHRLASVDDDTFALRLAVPDPLKEPLTTLVSEPVDWRLAKYLDGRSATQGGAECQPRGRTTHPVPRPTAQPRPPARSGRCPHPRGGRL